MSTERVKHLQAGLVQIRRDRAAGRISRHDARMEAADLLARLAGWGS